MTKSSIIRDRLSRKLHDPRFRRGDYVIRAKDWVNKIGVRPETVAKLVIDIEPDPGGRKNGWHVGVERCGVQFHHENEFCLLEEIDDHHVYQFDNKFYWFKGAQPES
jgi:hypothetical protein